MKRYFDWSQKNEVFLNANGKCEQCGNLLDKGWHAHHKIPWAEGGPTIVENGMALCPECHIILTKEYGPMNQDTIERRQPQEELITAAIKKLSEGKEKPVLTALLACGSGKTFGAIDVCNLLYREGVIKGAIFLTPRRKLCEQYETAWNYSGRNDPLDFSQFFASPKISKIKSVQNKLPVLWPEQFGYSLTYNSLVSDDNNNRIHWSDEGICNRDFALVLDEAQCLAHFQGESDKSRLQARAFTESVKNLYDHPNCRFVILMTATEVRSDNLGLFLGEYAESDKDGYKYLKSDVRYTYIDGVNLKYLRPFEFELYRVKLEIERFGIDSQDIYSCISNENKKQLERFLRQPEVWQHLTDKTIERLLFVREDVWTGYKGMITAIDIRHADEIRKYIQSKHKNLKCLTVVGDVSAIGEDDNGGDISSKLSEFIEGNYDILLNVRMAYVGFNCPEITVVGVLTHWRHPSFLEQLTGRGGRVLATRSYDEQVLYVIGLDDPKMNSFADDMRKATLRYLKEIGEREIDLSDEPTPDEQLVFETVSSVGLLGSTGIGLIEVGDLGIEHHEPLSEKLKNNHMAIPPTVAAALIRESGGSIGAFIGQGFTERQDFTVDPNETTLRNSIEEKMKSLAGYISRRTGDKNEWLSEKIRISKSLFPNGIDNHWRKFKDKDEDTYLRDLSNINALLEARIADEKRLARKRKNAQTS